MKREGVDGVSRYPLSRPLPKEWKGLYARKRDKRPATMVLGGTWIVELHKEGIARLIILPMRGGSAPAGSEAEMLTRSKVEITADGQNASTCVRLTYKMTRNRLLSTGRPMPTLQDVERAFNWCACALLEAAS